MNIEPRGDIFMYDFKPPYYGAAYYPEAWPREEVDKDLDRLVAHGLNTVRVAEFAWSTMEPEEGKYDFSLFREVVDKCKARGISVVMCTPSATPPSWMEHNYPEIMMEIAGEKMTHGHRRMSCPTNKKFRYFCSKIVEEMAREFANDENIIGWQLDNEISIMPKKLFGCTCEGCRKGFKDYLRHRYGTIEALNDAWEHYTWSMNFSSFDEVDANDGAVNLPAAQQYLWEEYKNACYQDFLLDQVKILRKYTKAPIGTDMMPTHQFDIQGINNHLDVAQFNHYSGPAAGQHWFDAYRNSADKFWVTETSCSWGGGNTPVGPRAKGFCKANTLSSFALGGEMVLYWLFRSHKGGHEMAHGSVIDAWGRDMHTSDEVRGISRDLDLLRPMISGTKPKRNGIAVAYGHRAYEIATYAPMTTMGNSSDYTDDFVKTVYNPLNQRHCRPDVISMYHDLTPYKLLINYRTYTLDEGDFLDRIMPWVEKGGTWIVGPMTDIFTKDLAKYRHAPFGHMEGWADVERKFFMPASNGWHLLNRPCTDIILDDGTTLKTKGLTYDAFVPGKSAKALGKYAGGGDEYLEGHVAITETKVGKGRIIMMGAALDDESFAKFICGIAAELGIFPISEGDRTVVTSLLEGEYGTVFCAIETDEQPAKIKIPFNSTDILTKRRYFEGEMVDMGKFECIFAKKD